MRSVVRLFFLLTLLVVGSQFSSSQTFYLDIGTNPTPLTFSKDSCSATDSSFFMFTPPITVYSRGFTVLNKSGDIATFRLVQISAPTTALDSLVTTASAIGQNTRFTSAKAGSKVALTAGTAYRIEFISSNNKPWIEPKGVWWFTLQ